MLAEAVLGPNIRVVLQKDIPPKATDSMHVLYSAEKTKSCGACQLPIGLLRQEPGGVTHVVGCRDGNAVLEWVPAHVQDLLVEIDLVGICLLAHPLSLARRRAACAGTALLASVGHGAGRRVDGSGHPNLLSLKCRLVGLEHDLHLLL